MGFTSSEVKNRYNKKTYLNHNIRIRKDDVLNEKIQAYKKTGSFSALVKELLSDYFEKQN